MNTFFKKEKKKCKSKSHILFLGSQDYHRENKSKKTPKIFFPGALYSPRALTILFHFFLK